MLELHYSSLDVGSFIQCLYPYPRSVSECDLYEAVTCHFLFGGDASSDDETSERKSSTLVGFSVSFLYIACGYYNKQSMKSKTNVPVHQIWTFNAGNSL